MIGTASASSGIVADAIGSPAANAGVMGSSAGFVDLCLQRRFLRFKWLAALLPVVVVSLSAVVVSLSAA